MKENSATRGPPRTVANAEQAIAKPSAEAGYLRLVVVPRAGTYTTAGFGAITCDPQPILLTRDFAAASKARASGALDPDHHDNSNHSNNIVV